MQAGGQATGEAFVQFANGADLDEGLKRHKQSLGSRYIELFRSSYEEVQSTTQRAAAQPPRGYGGGGYGGGAVGGYDAGASGAGSFAPDDGQEGTCIRMRGLPWEADAAAITTFFSVSFWPSSLQTLTRA
jgi:hypothetical protein